MDERDDLDLDLAERGRVVHELSKDGENAQEPLVAVEVLTYGDYAPSGRRRGAPPDEMARLAAKGGKAAHRMGKAHEFTSESGRVAGRKGGAVTRERALRRAQGAT
jgi:hypothetical protein